MQPFSEQFFVLQGLLGCTDERSIVLWRSVVHLQQPLSGQLGTDNIEDCFSSSGVVSSDQTGIQPVYLSKPNTFIDMDIALLLPALIRACEGSDSFIKLDVLERLPTVGSVYLQRQLGRMIQFQHKEHIPAIPVNLLVSQLLVQRCYLSITMLLHRGRSARHRHAELPLQQLGKLLTSTTGGFTRSVTSALFDGEGLDVSNQQLLLARVRVCELVLTGSLVAWTHCVYPLLTSSSVYLGPGQVLVCPASTPQSRRLQIIQDITSHTQNLSFLDQELSCALFFYVTADSLLSGEVQPHLALTEELVFVLRKDYTVGINGTRCGLWHPIYCQDTIIACLLHEGVFLILYVNMSKKVVSGLSPAQDLAVFGSVQLLDNGGSPRITQDTINIYTKVLSMMYPRLPFKATRDRYTENSDEKAFSIDNHQAIELKHYSRSVSFESSKTSLFNELSGSIQSNSSSSSSNISSNGSSSTVNSNISNISIGHSNSNNFNNSNTFECSTVNTIPSVVTHTHMYRSKASLLQLYVALMDVNEQANFRNSPIDSLSSSTSNDSVNELHKMSFAKSLVNLLEQPTSPVVATGIDQDVVLAKFLAYYNSFRSAVHPGTNTDGMLSDHSFPSASPSNQSTNSSNGLVKNSNSSSNLALQRSKSNAMVKTESADGSSTSSGNSNKLNRNIRLDSHSSTVNNNNGGNGSNINISSIKDAYVNVQNISSGSNSGSSTSHSTPRSKISSTKNKEAVSSSSTKSEARATGDIKQDNDFSVSNVNSPSELSSEGKKYFGGNGDSASTEKMNGKDESTKKASSAAEMESASSIKKNLASDEETVKLTEKETTRVNVLENSVVELAVAAFLEVHDGVRQMQHNLYQAFTEGREGAQQTATACTETLSTTQLSTALFFLTHEGLPLAKSTLPALFGLTEVRSSHGPGSTLPCFAHGCKGCISWVQFVVAAVAKLYPKQAAAEPAGVPTDRFVKWRVNHEAARGLRGVFDLLDSNGEGAVSAVLCDQFIVQTAQQLGISKTNLGMAHSNSDGLLFYATFVANVVDLLSN